MTQITIYNIKAVCYSENPNDHSAQMKVFTLLNLWFWFHSPQFHCFRFTLVALVSIASSSSRDKFFN